MDSKQGTDPAWVQTALERYEGPLLRHAARFTGDIDRARDVVQDTFIRLWQADQTKVNDHLAEWLFTVCRRRALEILRKEGRMTPLLDDQLERTANADPTPAAVAERRDEKSRALGLLAALPERQRELIRLKFQNNLSYKQISRITDLSVSNVGFILHTAIHSLRQRLQEEA